MTKEMFFLLILWFTDFLNIWKGRNKNKIYVQYATVSSKLFLVTQIEQRQATDWFFSYTTWIHLKFSKQANLRYSKFCKPKIQNKCNLISRFYCPDSNYRNHKLMGIFQSKFDYGTMNVWRGFQHIIPSAAWPKCRKLAICLNETKQK